MRSRVVSAALFCVVLAALSHPRSLTPPLESSPVWREAAPGYQFSFPRDHRAHMDSRIEWWYYTGNLETKSGRRFGYQLTFFRVGVVREPANSSRWALRDLHMAHFAISDIESQAFHSFERINRAGIGWAGADTVDWNTPVAEHSAKSTVRVWNEDWDARIEDGSHTLRAAEGGFSIAMTLRPSKPEVIHGEKGISQKGPSAENASHYYSLTRLESSGLIEVEGESFEVSGLSWMDHEFGTSFLYDQQAGWDWFSIHLQDGRDLMLLKNRRRDGSIDSSSSGTLIDAGGNATHLNSEDFSLEPGEHWRSSKSGAEYPTAWKIHLPGYGLLLTVTAEIEDQELHTPESTAVTYWEGPVSIRGADGNRPVRGVGYLEMTGYAKASIYEVLR
jgi:predicted secreted hydrolase